jgi:hypothetical protein
MKKGMIELFNLCLFGKIETQEQFSYVTTKSGKKGEEIFSSDQNVPTTRL